MVNALQIPYLNTFLNFCATSLAIMVKIEAMRILANVTLSYIYERETTFSL